MSAKDIFESQIADRLNDPVEGPKMCELDAIFQFNITGNENGTWFVDLKSGGVGVGENDEADCTVTIDADDFIDLYNGDTQGAMLFMSGKLQIDGNMGLALKLGEIMG